MKKSVIRIDDLTADEITHIFELADTAHSHNIEWESNLSACFSFEGNSLRTRATFVKALFDLGITPIELPNLLKTQEAVEHLAGYLDHWFDIYVIRDRNHERLLQFAEVSERPVINALSSEAHPCEVLADLYSVRQAKGDLKKLKFCILGPPTNVLNSWSRAGRVLDLDYVHVLPDQYDEAEAGRVHIARSKSAGLQGADVILTDAWPADFSDQSFQLTLQDLEVASSDAWVIPCPPFNIKNEIHQEVIESSYFAGYAQKEYLYHVQKALVYFLLTLSTS